jgi:uncharacterized protein (TIGR02996 family)
MTDRAAFLAAIVAAPDDDLPRLVFADWLDEYGEPERAEFIRVQCELAKLRAKGCHEGETCNVTGQCAECNRDVEAEPLRRRERELWTAGVEVGTLPDEAARLWTLGLPGDSHSGNWPVLTVHRGFISHVTCSWPDWHRHSAALLAACPIAGAKDGQVRLTTWPQWELPEDWDFVDRRVRFPGGRWHLISLDDPLVEPANNWVAGKILAAEWPGVRFELPAANPWPGHPVEGDALHVLGAGLAEHSFRRAAAQFESATLTYPPLVPPR